MGKGTKYCLGTELTQDSNIHVTYIQMHRIENQKTGCLIRSCH